MDRIPEYMRDGVVDYLDYGLEPGGFLRAVLENDLVGAFGKADRTNTEAMGDWATFLYNDMPHEAWGSPEKVEAWIEKRRLERVAKEVKGDNPETSHGV